MVRSLFLRSISCVALVSMGLFALAGTASAQQQATDLHFTTAIKAVYGSPYPLTGRLDLQVFPSGTIRGFYHTSYYKLNIPVVGGRDGNYIWLTIGPSTVDLGLNAGPEGRLHIVGSMNNDGSFSGQVYPENAAVISGISMQLNTPGPNSPEQYLFSATPVESTSPSETGSASPQP
jgi:hypothetical protein